MEFVLSELTSTSIKKLENHIGSSEINIPIHMGRFQYSSIMAAWTVSVQVLVV
jgi:hypothetical protein